MEDRYIPARIEIQHTEGTTGDVMMTVSDVFPLEGLTIEIRVFSDTKEIFKKSTTDEEVSVDGQVILMHMNISDTNKRPGEWNLSIRAFSEEKNHYIGMGKFIVEKAS
jgi:hypothetical protein